MTVSMLAPTFTPVRAVGATLRDRGYAALSPDDVAAWADASAGAFDALRASWEALPLDAHLRDGGRYRRRRHASLIASPEEVTLAPPRAHWQPVAYNALHGGMRRWFDAMTAETLSNTAFRGLVRALATTCTALRPTCARWFVEAHQFRIDTTDGIGRPTPEGAHRDGVDFVAVMLVARAGVKGGETRVFEADGPRGERFTLTAPWTLLLLDDARVIHETTPIQPTAPDGHRDTLVITLRAGGFLDEPDDATPSRQG